jgi:hypothetical protein
MRCHCGARLNLLIDVAGVDYELVDAHHFEFLLLPPDKFEPFLLDPDMQLNTCQWSQNPPTALQQRFRVAADRAKGQLEKFRNQECNSKFAEHIKVCELDWIVVILWCPHVSYCCTGLQAERVRRLVAYLHTHGGMVSQRLSTTAKTKRQPS